MKAVGLDIGRRRVDVRTLVEKVFDVWGSFLLNLSLSSSFFFFLFFDITLFSERNAIWVVMNSGLLGLCSRRCPGIVIPVPPKFLHSIVGFEHFPRVLIIVTSHPSNPVLDLFDVRWSLIIVVSILRLILCLPFLKVSRLPWVWLWMLVLYIFYAAWRRCSLITQFLWLIILIPPRRLIWQAV